MRHANLSCTCRVLAVLAICFAVHAKLRATQSQLVYYETCTLAGITPSATSTSKSSYGSFTTPQANPALQAMLRSAGMGGMGGGAMGNQMAGMKSNTIKRLVAAVAAVAAVAEQQRRQQP